MTVIAQGDRAPMPARHRSVTRLVLAASVSALALLPAALPATESHIVLFFVPLPPPPPEPSLPGVVVRPRILLSPGPPAREEPPLRPKPPPAPRCYTGAAICPLEPSEAPGRPCSCPSAEGRVSGRALIPPSRTIGLAKSSGESR